MTPLLKPQLTDNQCFLHVVFSKQGHLSAPLDLMEMRRDDEWCNGE